MPGFFFCPLCPGFVTTHTRGLDPRRPLGRNGNFLVDSPKIVNRLWAKKMRHRYLLDIRQKSWAISPAFPRTFRQPNRAHLARFPDLTQQNLCYFVALATSKESSRQTMLPTFRPLPGFCSGVSKNVVCVYRAAIWYYAGRLCLHF